MSTQTPNPGQAHAAKRTAQAAAARKPVNQSRVRTRPGHGNRAQAQRAALKEHTA